MLYRDNKGRFIKGFHSSKKTEIKKGQHLSFATEFKKGRKNIFKGVKRPNFCRENNPNWKNGKAKCLDCKKELGEYRQHRCSNCYKIYKQKIGVSLETRQKLSKKLKGRISPNKNKKHPEVSKLLKKLWKQNDFVSKVYKGRNVRPNKPEKYLLFLLNKLFPNVYKYVGDFSFVIGGRNPDFIDIKHKKIIEFFGDYWHNRHIFPKVQSEYNRILHFNKYGYNVLVIKEFELKDINSLILKLKDFQLL